MGMYIHASVLRAIVPATVYTYTHVEVLKMPGWYFSSSSNGLKTFTDSRRFPQLPKSPGNKVPTPKLIKKKSSNKNKYTAHIFIDVHFSPSLLVVEKADGLRRPSAFASRSRVQSRRPSFFSFLGGRRVGHFVHFEHSRCLLVGRK